jgi:hypothetical protein
VLFIRAIWLAYRIWHLYESNNEFVFTVKKSKTYGTLIIAVNSNTILENCEPIDAPYLLRLSGLTLSSDAVELYKKVWDMSRCLQDPVILTSQLRDIAFIEYPVDNDNLQSALVPYTDRELMEEDIKPIIENTKYTWSGLLQEGIYGITVDYLFRKPSHTPIYDKWTEAQKKIKQYSRTLQFLAIDITDELMVFQQKFQQAMYTTLSIHSSFGILVADLIGGVYGGDKAVLLIEGAYQLAITDNHS